MAFPKVSKNISIHFLYCEHENENVIPLYRCDTVCVSGAYLAMFTSMDLGFISVPRNKENGSNGGHLETIKLHMPFFFFLNETGVNSVQKGSLNSPRTVSVPAIFAQASAETCTCWSWGNPETLEELSGTGMTINDKRKEDKPNRGQRVPWHKREMCACWTNRYLQRFL